MLVQRKTRKTKDMTEQQTNNSTINSSNLLKTKIKLLYMGDYVCATGFGTVSRNIITNLMKTGEYEVDVLGINYNGDPYDHNEWPGNVYPAMPGGMMRAPYNDVFGRQRLIDMMALHNYDAVMILQDTFVIKDVSKALKEASEATGTSVVFYYPVDSTLDASWVKGVVDAVDFPVAYTQFGKTATLSISPEIEPKLSVVYHGTNTKDFHYINNRADVAKARKEYFNGVTDGRFLIMNIARNQIRKDVLHSLLTIKELRKVQPRAMLYLHMAENDQGGSVDTIAMQLGLKNGVDYIVPAQFNKGLSVEKMNMLYNFSDALLMTPHGEGWGLPMTEAFATKTPVIAAKNTSLVEMGADNRAILVDCCDYVTYAHADNNRVRPVIDYRMAAVALDGLIKGEMSPDVEGAYEWAHAFNWNKICEGWNEILHKAADLTATKRRLKDADDMKTTAKVQLGGERDKLAAKRKRERQNKKKARR
jgi:glycosyltransferase involved in cell wall biosynthesis